VPSTGLTEASDRLVDSLVPVLSFWMFKFISCCGSWLINNDNLWLHTSFVGCLPREAKARYEHLRLVNSACV